MELKIDLTEQLDKYIDSGVKSQLLQGTVSHILKELTPDRLEKLVEAMLKDALGSFSSYGIRSHIEDYAKTYVQRALKEPDVQKRIDLAVREATEKVIVELPETIKASIANRVSESLKSHWTR